MSTSILDAIEIHSVFFALDTVRALEPDGFSSSFFQSSHDVIFRTRNSLAKIITYNSVTFMLYHQELITKYVVSTIIQKCT